MNTHLLLLTGQYITIAVLFVEILIIFPRWKNSIHSYLLLACISSFISNIGYLFELSAKSEEAYLIALKLSYVGRVWIVFAFFLFAAKMCGIRLPKPFLLALVFIHTGIYLAVLAVGNSDLYYKDYRFVPDPEFPKFYHTNGVVHDFFMALNVILCIFAFGWLIREFRKEKNRKPRQRLFMVILAFGVQIFSFIVQVTKMFPIAEYYDFTMPGVFLGTIFMLIGILGFDLLGTREIARDFAMDRISEGIIAVDNAGRIKYFNEPAADIYPEFHAFYSLKSKIGAHIKKRKSGSERTYTPYDIISFIDEAVQKGETLAVDGRIYTPEENDLCYKGESYGKLYALVDDTEHYQYMEELKKQKDIADSANESKSRFLANMSHEIRTPINAVLGMDEMILRESGEKTIRAYAADIMSAGRTLLSLINDILDLSKVEEGKMEIIPVQYELSVLINDLSNMIRDRAAKKGLIFHIRADEHTPNYLYGDEIRIRQCAMNLLTNAVKYTEKGEVTFDISYSRTAENHILLCITVADTGIGMKTEDMEKLFSPYQRIEEERNRSIEGTGLGMSITRQLLELMGSTLEVRSEYGKGSAFSFSVDQEVTKWEELGDYSSRFDGEPADSYEYHELFHAPDARILVVDDTEMNLTVIRSLLKRTRIGIDTASSGGDAVRLTSEKQYDVLFIDHMMPDMDGIETLEAIRSSGMNTDVPAVALTANAVSGAKEMYLKAGFTDYLSKPVDGKKLEMLLLEKLPKEKVLAADAGEEAAGENGVDVSGEEKPPAFMEKLKEMDEIDEAAGKKNCGSEEGYQSVLSVFHQTAAVKADEIEKFFREGNIGEYTIRVHALKSSARIIGANALSALARDLEDAGKREDVAYIKDNTEKLLEMYRALDAHLSWLDEADESLPMISEEAMKEAYQTILEIAGSMDYGLMEGILKSLKDFQLPKSDAEKIARIEGMLTELNWEGIIKIIGEDA